DLDELLGRRQSFPQGGRLALRHVELGEVVAGVTGDGRGNPAAGVDVHQTQGRIRGNPQRRSLGGRAVQPLGHETDVFQQRGDVVTQRQTFVLYTNQNDDFHRLALVVPDAVDLGRAQLLHLFGDDLLGLD